MGETGIFRFPGNLDPRAPGNLDPRAQEFWPRNNVISPAQFPIIRPPQVYYDYPFPPTPLPPPPPPPPLPSYPQNDVPVLSFPHVCGGGGVGFTQYPTPPPVYVSTTLHPPLPPPSVSPTRTLVLSSVASDVSETVVRTDLEVFGEVRGVQMERVREGIVTVHFYDLRHAEKALKEIREQHMQQQNRLRNHYCALVLPNNSATCENEPTLVSSSAAAAPPLPPPAHGLVAGRAVWAQFTVPANNAVPDGNNQGTIVIFNLDSGITSLNLREIFQAFGPVKELRETPLKKQQRFVEFYDVRDASNALREMNGKEIHGKPVVIEFSRPGGHNKKFFNANNSSIISTSCSNNFAFINSTSNNYQTRNSDYPPPQPPPPPPPQSLPCNFTTRLPRSTHSQTQSFKKRQLSSSVKGNPSENGVINVISSIEASMASLSMDSGSLANEVDVKSTAGAGIGTPRKNNNNCKKIQMNETTASNGKQHVIKNRNRPWKGRPVKNKFDTRFLINEDAISESNCTDCRTTVMIKNIPNKYSQKLLLNMLDNHCIHCNEQIPEGEDQPLSSYDFVYLPIDFNNKCNVGYGFVNMTSPEATWRLYKAFHLQSWEVFNSRKICEVTYARVQGLEALKEHFKNSKFPSEMDHYLPVAFSPPRDGKQLTEPQPIAGQSKPPLPLALINTNRNASDDDHDQNDLLLVDGADTPDNTTTTANDSDCADQTDVLIGGSCGYQDGGDVADDYNTNNNNDRDSGSSVLDLLVA